MATSHPERAPSAADIEKALSGIQYPRTKEELFNYASQQVSDKNLVDIINSLPSRVYRDSAEIAIALGEVKQKQGIRSAEEVAQTEAPGTKGGRVAAAAVTSSVSAATVAKVLSGVDFPKNKGHLRDYAQKHMKDVGVADPQRILSVIDSLPDQEYQNMADVEKSVGQLL
jgi:acyl-CoA synthetase (NDP forming)